VKFTIDISKLPDLTNMIGDINLPKIMNEEMQAIRADIISESLAGRTADGGALKPYSRSYIEAIDSGYIEGKSPGNHTVNLTATGQLLRSLVVEAQGMLVKLFFYGSHSKPNRVSHEHADKKRTQATDKGHVIQHHGNRPTPQVNELRAVTGKGKILNGKSRKGKKKQGGGGGDTQNAVIAKGQYAMGRSGWFQIAPRASFQGRLPLRPKTPAKNPAATSRPVSG
jgi:hypothetical protein